MNRIIQRTGSDVVFMVGPGHGGPALVAQTYLEGTWMENYPTSGVTPDDAGMRKLFRQFSAPGGIPSHCSPDVPGSIHEGGELGYVLVHAFGAVMDSPDLVVLAVVGDGEAETGPLEGSWKSISFINPVHDGAVLPVMHLNEAKISGPTVLGRESNENILKLFQGHGYEVIFVEGDDPKLVHQALAKALDYSMAKIRAIQKEARATGKCEERPRWPLIILRTPKGWTGPKQVDGKKVSGTFRSHQVPLSTVRENDQHKEMLEEVGNTALAHGTHANKDCVSDDRIATRVSPFFCAVFLFLSFSGCARTIRRICSTRRASSSRSWPRWPRRA